jgi:hypothetical protein
MTYEQQLEQWLKGNSVHNERMLGKNKISECCPDFSCCIPELLAPVEVRQIFVNAVKKGDDKMKDRMLMEFLGRMLDNHYGKDNGIHIAGLEEARQEIDE